MPGGDHTGPLGVGPRTGRAAGYCAGYDEPGHVNSGPGFYGRGWGRGRARGRRRGRCDEYYATPLLGWHRGRGFRRRAVDDIPLSREQELSRLKADLNYLEQNAERLRNRIDELSAQESTTQGA